MSTQTAPTIIYCPDARKPRDFPHPALADADVAIGAGHIVLKDRHGHVGRVAFAGEVAQATIVERC